MHNFWKGLALVFVGFVVWFLCSVVAGIGEGLTGVANPIFITMYKIGFVTMIIGGFLFWIVLPLRDRFGRRI